MGGLQWEDLDQSQRMREVDLSFENWMILG